MTARSRKRYVRYGGDVVGMRHLFGGTPSVQTRTAYTFLNSIVDHTHRGPPYKSGGPLAISRKRISFKDSTSASLSGASGTSYGGIFWMPPVFTTTPSETSLAGWGAKGWALTLPTRPIAQFGVSLFELKDAPRMLLQTKEFLRKLLYLVPSFSKPGKTVGDFLSDLKAHGSTGLGSDYLNLEFGWVPILSDLALLLKAGEKLRNRLRQLKRDNGKSIRRRYAWPVVDYREDLASYFLSGSSGGYLSPSLSGSAFATGGSSSITRSVEHRYYRRIWYVAKYRYYVPKSALYDDSSWGHLDLMGHFLGLRLSVSTIYRALPWSWLIDWFTNLGTIISNIESNAKFHIVADYAYVMCHEKHEYTFKGNGRYHSHPSFPDDQLQTFSASSTLTQEYKRREEASPYGFDLNWDSFTPYQWSILAALGLTRLH